MIDEILARRRMATEVEINRAIAWEMARQTLPAGLDDDLKDLLADDLTSTN